MHKKKQDIATLSDIRLLVDTFYGRVQEDALIGPIFKQVIKDRWPEHLNKMYNFWQTVLFGEQTYSGAPFPPHAKLPVSQAHFDNWLRLWHGTVDELFAGEKAEEAKWRGDKMAAIFLSKIEHYRNNQATPLH